MPDVGRQIIRSEPLVRAVRRAATVITTIAVCVAATSLSGCGLFTRNSPTVEGPRIERHAPAVVVLESGAAPRRPLRFALERGTVSEVELRVDLHVTQHPADTTTATGPPTTGTAAGLDPGRAQVIDPPATYQRVRFTVTGVDADGHDVEFELLDTGIDPQGTVLTDVQIVEVAAAVQRLVGLRGQMRLDARGAVSSISFGPVPASAPTGEPADRARTEARLRDVEQQLATVVPLLPVEPVGRGARWRTTGRSTLAGTSVRQTTTYEVTAVDGDVVLYRATISQVAGEQTLDPGAGSAPQLVAAELTGATNGRFSLVDLGSESETRLVGSQLLDVGSDRASRVRQELDLVVSAGPPPS